MINITKEINNQITNLDNFGTNIDSKMLELKDMISHVKKISIDMKNSLMNGIFYNNNNNDNKNINFLTNQINFKQQPFELADNKKIFEIDNLITNTNSKPGRNNQFNINQNAIISNVMIPSINNNPQLIQRNGIIQQGMNNNDKTVLNIHSLPDPLITIPTGISISGTLDNLVNKPSNQNNNNINNNNDINNNYINKNINNKQKENLHDSTKSKSPFLSNSFDNLEDDDIMETAANNQKALQKIKQNQAKTNNSINFDDYDP